LRSIIKICLTILIVWYLLEQLPLEKMHQTICNGNIKYLVISFIFVPLFILVKALKWHLIVRNAGATEGFGLSIKAILVGLGFGIITPGRAGEVARAQFYKSTDKYVVSILVFTDRIIDLLTILIFCNYYFFNSFDGKYFFIALFLNLSGIVLICFSRFYNRFLKLLIYKIDVGFIKKIATKFLLATESLNLENIIKYSSISIVIWIISIIQFFFIVSAFQNFTLIGAVESYPVIQLSNLIPVTIMGLGIREGLSVIVLNKFEINENVAVLASFLGYFINIFLPAILGLIIFGFSGKKDGKNR
jgi:glycosyltransferase 2 family protein